MAPKIACIIPTHNGGVRFPLLLNSLKLQSISFDLFIVDSDSRDGTNTLAKSSGISVIDISPSQFNHGGTRQMMVNNNPGYDIYVFLTQDAILIGKDAISSLIAPFSDSTIGAVCGRQIPHLNATAMAQHARFFNYPDHIEIKSQADIPVLGIKTAFMSNSFAAYRGNALNEVGGFPSHVIFAEDMYVTAKMLMSGWKVAYTGNAKCYHSHNYALTEEFKRYFDMGVFHAREPWIRDNFGGAGSEGIRYIKSELRFLGLRRMHLWIPVIIRNAIKLFGYKLGQKEAKLPLWLKRKFGMHARYWDGPYAISS
jgi:rhamnosyltransferase